MNKLFAFHSMHNFQSMVLYVLNPKHCILCTVVHALHFTHCFMLLIRCISFLFYASWFNHIDLFLSVYASNVIHQIPYIFFNESNFMHFFLFIFFSASCSMHIVICICNLLLSFVAAHSIYTIV